MGRNDVSTDADHAIFQRFGYTEDLGHVPRVEIGGQTELGMLAMSMTSSFVSKLKSGATGPKTFLAGDLHVFRHARQNGRLEEQAATLIWLSAKCNGCTLGDGVFDVLLPFSIAFAVLSGPALTPDWT